MALWQRLNFFKAYAVHIYSQEHQPSLDEFLSDATSQLAILKKDLIDPEMTKLISRSEHSSFEMMNVKEIENQLKVKAPYVTDDTLFNSLCYASYKYQRDYAQRHPKEQKKQKAASKKNTDWEKLALA